MKKILIFVLLYLFPFSISAYFCDYNDYKEAQKKALNVNVMLDYEILEEQAVFTITIYNLKEQQYILDKKNDRIYRYQGKDSLEIKVTEAGSYSFEVYSDENYCDSNYLNKLFVEVPNYNKFYTDSLCLGIENYKYCQKWFGTKITYDEFQRGVTEYRNSLKQDKQEEDDNYKSIYEYIMEFYLAYWFIILPVIIVVCLLGIFLKKKQENKFNL